MENRADLFKEQAFAILQAVLSHPRSESVALDYLPELRQGQSQRPPNLVGHPSPILTP
jgi:hypothetical protein